MSRSTTAEPLPVTTHPPGTVARRRRRTAGVLLAVGGLALAASQVVQPRGGDEVFAVSLAGSRERWVAWGVLVMVSALLQLPAVVLLRASVTTGRGARLTGAGGALTALSLVALFGFGLTHADLATLVGPAPVRPDVLAAFQRLDESVSLGVTTVLALAGFHLGWPLLLAGLARARRFPPALAVVGAASVFLSLFGAVLGAGGEVALFLLAGLCLAACGVVLVRDPAAGGQPAGRP